MQFLHYIFKVRSFPGAKYVKEDQGLVLKPSVTVLLQRTSNGVTKKYSRPEKEERLPLALLGFMLGRLTKSFHSFS